MRRAIVFAAAAALCLTGVGCSNGDSPGPTSTASAPPSSGSTVVSQSPRGTADPPHGPPVLPHAATAKTTAGAKAFVRYYVAALNYSWHSLEVKAISHVSAGDCNACQLIIQKISATARRNGYQHGGDWTVLHSYEVPGSTPNDTSMLVKIHIGSGKYAESGVHSAQRIVPGSVTNEVDLRFSGGGWRTIDLRST